MSTSRKNIFRRFDNSVTFSRWHQAAHPHTHRSTISRLESLEILSPVTQNPATTFALSAEVSPFQTLAPPVIIAHHLADREGTSRDPNRALFSTPREKRRIHQQPDDAERDEIGMDRVHLRGGRGLKHGRLFLSDPTTVNPSLSTERRVYQETEETRTRDARFELSRLWGADHYLDEPPGSLDKTRWGRSGRRANSPLSLSLPLPRAPPSVPSTSLSLLFPLFPSNQRPHLRFPDHLLVATPSPLDPAGCARAPPSPMHLACVPPLPPPLTDRVTRANVCDRGWRLDDAASPQQTSV